MFSGYEPLTGELANDHIARIRRLNTETLLPEESAFGRLFVLRVPMLLLSRDEQILLRDMTALENPTEHACLTPPAAVFNNLSSGDTYGYLVSKYLRKEVFPSHRFARMPGRIGPLGVYKNYAADNDGGAKDITSIPAKISLDLDHSEFQISGRYQRFRGHAVWMNLVEAYEALTMQSEEMTENNLALEALLLVSELKNQLERTADAAHPRAV